MAPDEANAAAYAATCAATRNATPVTIPGKPILHQPKDTLVNHEAMVEQIKAQQDPSLRPPEEPQAPPHPVSVAVAEFDYLYSYQPVKDGIKLAWRGISHVASRIGANFASAEPIVAPVRDVSVEQFTKEFSTDFQVKMGFGIDREGSLRGHVVVAGVNGMPDAYKLEPLFALLDFKRGDVVLVEGTDEHCGWWLKHGVPRANCIPLDSDSPQFVRQFQQAEKALLDDIGETAGMVYANLPERLKKAPVFRLHVDALLRFIEGYVDKVVPEAVEKVQRQMARMEAAHTRFEEVKASAALERQTRTASTAELYKRKDRIVVVASSCENAVGMAQRMYQNGDIVMNDRRTVQRIPEARLPDPIRTRTDL